MLFSFFNMIGKMTKLNPSVEHDQNIIEALEKLPKTIYDKKHDITVCFDNKGSRSNESRFEHIAKKYHQLKVRDIKAIPEGIRSYVRFIKDKDCQETYCYFINRKGEDDGFIKVAVKLYEHDKKKAYVKSIFIVYRIKKR